MTKTNEKEIVEIANRTVGRFIKLWKKNPYLWDTEADIHGELYVMIKSALKRKGLIRGCYKEYMDRKEYFSRVYCKPLTHIGKNKKYYPDIVIYEKLTFKNKDEINEPMLWVCEIKYKTQWGGDQSLENRNYDKTKLRKLLRQRNSKIKGAKYAYVLHFFRYEHIKKDPEFKSVSLE
ncbi:MAG: hypothetical protein FJZ16_09745 [Candidatus Omnitrophica bacterium]|nr:hypothetical protein [Candidatus Omnitrophota bacterium]